MIHRGRRGKQSKRGSEVGGRKDTEQVKKQEGVRYV